MMEEQGSARNHWWVIPGLWIAGFLTFIPLLPNRFIGDDYTALSIHRAFKGQPFFKTILYGGNDFLRPVNLTMVMLRGEIFGPNPLPFVIANIVLHLINTTMVFVLARRIFKKELAAIVSSAFFLVAFSHYEGITWISSSISMLVTCFMLLSLYGHIRFREDTGPAWLILVIPTLILALLTKETAVSLPFLMLAYDLFLVKREDRGKRFLLPYAIYGALLIAYLVAQTGFAMRFAGTGSPYRPGWHVLTNIVDYWVWFWIPNPRHPYVAGVLGILPRPLLYVYWFLAGAVALTLPLLVILAALKKLSRPIVFSFVSVFIALAVFLPFSIKISARYAYLPSMFVSLLAAGLFARLWEWLRERKKRIWSAAAAVIGGLYLAGNVVGLVLIEREFVRVSTTTERLARKVGGLVKLEDEDVLFIEGLPAHVHLREALQWYSNLNLHVYASNDAYRGSPKTIEDTRKLFKGSGMILYYLRVEEGKPVLVSGERL